MAVVEKRIKAGRTVTVLQGQRRTGRKGPREKRKNGTTPAQKEGNLRRATQMLGWLMAENFKDGDLLVTLDYKKRTGRKVLTGCRRISKISTTV